MSIHGSRQHHLFLLSTVVPLGLALLYFNEWVLGLLPGGRDVFLGRALVAVRLFDLACVVAASALLLGRKTAWVERLAAYTFEERPRLGAGLFGVGLSLVLVVLVELGFAGLNGLEPPDQLRLERHYSPALYVLDEHLGARFAADSAIEHRVSRDGKALYDVIYHSDSCRRRYTPQDHQRKKDGFVLFFGGSYTFGQGVSDNETLPAKVAARAPHQEVHNYAAPGYGCQQMLYILENWDLTEQVAAPTGTVVYVFIPAHVQRAVGSMRLISLWYRDYPCYELDATDGPRFLGSFAEAQPWRTMLYDLMAKEQVYRFLGRDWPPMGRGQVRFVAALVEAAAHASQAQFPDSNFVVLLYPGGYDKAFSSREASWEFRVRGIKTLDYSDRLDLSDPAYCFGAGDWHPKPAAHEKVAHWLVEDLELR